MRRCALCNKKKEENESFFSVPQDERRRNKWSEVCQIKFAAISFVCVDHFSPNDIIRGRRNSLMPSAVPSVGLKTNNAAVNSENEVFANQMEGFARNFANLNKTLMAPQLKEELLVDIPVMTAQLQDEHVTEMPTPQSCSSATQTNTHFCGLVEALELSNEFRLNCFYCSEVFPLEKWNLFAKHLREDHFEIEQGFQTYANIAEDHDYSSIDLSPSAAEDTIIEPVVNHSKDPLEVADIPFESVSSHISTNVIQSESTVVNSLNPNELSVPKEIESDSEDLSDTKSLSPSPRRTNEAEEEFTVGEKEENVSNSIEISPQKPTEIAFEYAPPDVMNLLLDSMQNYPVLWLYDEEPFNEDFYEAIEDLCNKINDKWSLNIDNLKMRRSINRILRYYCYLFPNENVQNINQFTCYYDKCATFLPSSVNEIAYARCSHCYICYKNDSDLKRHLLDEYKYLQWPYKCVRCKECFTESDEYEFHKLLPHYDENFRCDQCSKSFFHRNKYNKHMSDYHTKEPRYKCNICDKEFRTRNTFRNHELIHGEKNYKCHLCPNSYYVRGTLSRHLKFHRREYNHMCELCGNKYFSQSGLKQHMKKHTGEKITCNICNLKLRKSSLNRHLQLLHVAYEGTIEQTSKGRHVNYRRKRRKECIGKNFYCKICKLLLENYDMVVEHNNEFHPDQKWSCKMCIKEFCIKRSLQRHYRRHHHLEPQKIRKLVEENQYLNVLTVDKENLDEITTNKSKQNNVNIEGGINGDSSSDEIYVEDENINTTEIQYEIMRDEDDYFTEFLEDP